MTDTPENIQAEDIAFTAVGRVMCIELKLGDVTIWAPLTEERMTLLRDAMAKHLVELNAANAKLQKAIGQNRHDRRAARHA